MLNIVLKLLSKLRRSSVALCKHDSSLNYLASDSVISRRDSALKHRRVFHKDTLYLERSYTITRSLDKVIRSSNIPVVAVIVHVSSVACVVHTKSPSVVRCLRVSVILLEQRRVLASLSVNNDLTCLAYLNRLALVVNDTDVVKRCRLTHRARLWLHAVKIAHKHSALCLTEALHKLKTCVLIPLVEYFRVKSLTGNTAIFQ